MYDAATYTYDAPRCVYKFTGKERDTESGLEITSALATTPARWAGS